MRSSTCLSCDDNSLVNGLLSLFTMYCTPLKTWPQFSPRESSYEPLQPLSCKCWPEPPQGCQKDQAKIWDCPYVLNPKKTPLKADLCWSNHKNVSNIPSTSPKILKYTKIMFYVTSGINGILYRVPGRVWHTVQMPPALEILFKILNNRPIKLC